MTMRYSNSSRRAACSGFSLIELLLALAISVVTLLGFAQLQQKNLSIERELMRSLHARLLLNEISETIEASANPDNYATSGTLSPSAANCLSRPCNPREFARFQLALWGCRVIAKSSGCRSLGITKSPFPEGQFIIRRSGQHFLIQLKWQTISGKERTITRKSIPLKIAGRNS